MVLYPSSVNTYRVLHGTTARLLLGVHQPCEAPLMVHHSGQSIRKTTYKLIIYSLMLSRLWYTESIASGRKGAVTVPYAPVQNGMDVSGCHDAPRQLV